MKPVLAHLFSPDDPRALAFHRIVFFGGLTLVHGVAAPRGFGAHAALPDEFWMPIELFAGFGRPAVDPATLEVLATVWRVSLFTACIGFFTRTSTLLSLGLGLPLLGYLQCFGKVSHASAIVIFIMSIFAVSHCDRAWTLDLWLRPRSPAPASGEFRWPIRLVRVLLALMYFGAGVAKLRYAGWAWVAPENMATVLFRPQYGLVPRPPLSGLGAELAGSAGICVLVAVAALVFELIAPLALVHRGARCVIMPVLFGMQVSIALFLGIGFYEHLVCYSFWWTPGFPARSLAVPGEERDG